jgi:uncharacterized protein YecE (DUF72 family)
MDFGKLSDISKVDFRLPPDAPETARVLAGALRKPKPHVYVGCPVWTCKEWNGRIYPSVAREKDYLYHYSRQFNTIELNTTHYRIPDVTTVNRWRTVSAKGFTFCPKWPQQISHDLALQYADAPAGAFIESIKGLAEHLGPSFLQLPPYFPPRQASVLIDFLETIPEEIPVAVEFRHEDWFKPSPQVEDTFRQMEQLGISTVLTDVAGRRDVLHMRLTTPIAFIRFVGNGLHPTDYRRIEEWTERVGEWFAAGLQSLYFFVHQPDNVLSPDLSLYLIRLLNQKFSLGLAEPRISAQAVQGSLF